MGRPGSQADLELVRAAEYTFRAKFADRWHRGNINLLGDAAHLTPPFIGQGMGAGLRDATNVAWKLAGVLNGSLAPSVLETYEQERKPHPRWLALQELAQSHERATGNGQRQFGVVDAEPAGLRGFGDIPQCAWRQAAIGGNQRQPVRQKHETFLRASPEQSAGEPEAACELLRWVVQRRGDLIQQCAVGVEHVRDGGFE